MTVSNYHTHTTYCDGRDTPEELVLQALSLGCKELGFTGHSFTAFDPRYCMSVQGTKDYRAEILALKDTYGDRLHILLGIEQDYFSDPLDAPYDYVLGSVHYVLKNGCYLPVDESIDLLKENVKKHYQGDYYAFCEEYYALVGDLYEKTHCDVIAHFDLVTKFLEREPLFDTAHPRYRRAALDALSRLLKTPVAFELNTGAIARGHRTTPYPEPFLFDRIRESGKRIVVSSDCHNKENLLFGIRDAYGFYTQ